MSRGEKSRKNFKFDSILDNKIFHLELQNVAKHCAISSECSSPHDPKGFSSHSFIQHPLLALFLLADVKTIHQECEPQYVQNRNCSDNSPGVSSGRHSLVGRRHHLCRLDSYRKVLQAQGRGVVKFCWSLLFLSQCLRPLPHRHHFALHFLQALIISELEVSVIQKLFLQNQDKPKAPQVNP